MSSPNLSPVAAAFALLEGHQEHTVTVKATQARHDFFSAPRVRGRRSLRGGRGRVQGPSRTRIARKCAVP